MATHGEIRRRMEEELKGCGVDVDQDGADQWYQLTVRLKGVSAESLAREDLALEIGRALQRVLARRGTLTIDTVILTPEE